MPPKLTVRACMECNADLGQKFENPAAPLLKPLVVGDLAEFTPAQLRSVAAWLWLKDIEYVLMRDVTYERDQDEKPMTEATMTEWRHHLRNLRRTVRPPEGYVARLGVIGHSADPATHASIRPFVRADFTAHYRGITSFNQVGRAVFQTTLTGSRAAAKLAAEMSLDDRTDLLWPADGTIAVPKMRLPFGDVVRWKDELEFHPNSQITSGFRMRIPPPVGPSRP
ncbi:hypothetical protein Q9R29_16660 [Rothia sp. ARF10]|nr:hypothetical protein [Rothia sp. ARF10]